VSPARLLSHTHLPSVVAATLRERVCEREGERERGRERRRTPWRVWATVQSQGARTLYLRLMDSCITQLKAQGPSRTCNESKEEEEAPCTSAWKGTLDVACSL